MVVYHDFLDFFPLKVAQVKEKERQGGKEEILTAHTAVCTCTDDVKAEQCFLCASCTVQQETNHSLSWAEELEITYLMCCFGN